MVIKEAARTDEYPTKTVLTLIFHATYRILGIKYASVCHYKLHLRKDIFVEFPDVRSDLLCHPSQMNGEK